MMSITAFIDKYFTFLVFIVDFEQFCLSDVLIGKPPNREIPVQKRQKTLKGSFVREFINPFMTEAVII